MNTSSLILSIDTLYQDLIIQRQNEKKNNDNPNCPKCNNFYPKDSRFCNKCGYSLLNN